MLARTDTVYQRPTVALEDYDFLRSTYEILARAPVPNRAAIAAAFEALDAAHDRLKTAHQHLMEGLLGNSMH
jgi:hypothetical protein